MSSQISPQELAEILNDKVTYYCARISEDTYLDCLLDHSPENLDDLADSYIDDEEIDEALENTDNTFWEEAKKEYEKLWMEDIANYIGGMLADEFDIRYRSIITDDSLTNGEKINLLNTLKGALKKLSDEIMPALNTQTPLDAYTLYKYIKDALKSAGFLSKNILKDIKYLLDYYPYLDEAGQLEALCEFLYQIRNILRDIDRDIEQYNSQGLPN